VSPTSIIVVTGPMVHKVGSLLTVILTPGAIYLLTCGRWQSACLYPVSLAT